MLDCLIRGGTIIDGTGNPRYAGDVGIRDGKIVSVGKTTESATRTIDADGRIVAPGIVDMHTHLDAQIMWDPTLVPYSLQGVTTIIGGQCGFGIAPINEKSVDYVVHMLANVEQMPVRALEIGLEPTWGSFAEWTSRIVGNSALNFGFFAAHSTIRRFVLGDDWRRSASPDEIQKMAAVLDETVTAGALGFSSSWNDRHTDHNGDPVPSIFADAEELIQLAAVLKNHPGTIIGFQPGSTPRFSERALSAMAEMSKAGHVRLNWNGLSIGANVEEPAIRERVAASDYAASRGAQVFALMHPTVMATRQSPSTTLVYNNLHDWALVMAMPPEERIRAFADPAVRSKLAAGLEGLGDELQNQNNAAKMSVLKVNSPELQDLEGRALTDIARERGCTPLDVWLDLAVADKLQCYFHIPQQGLDEKWKLLAELWDDESRIIVGGTDAGAHVDTIDSFTMFTQLLGPIVRDRQLLSLEKAVHFVTDQPARFNNIQGRGRLEVGWEADIMIFDPETVASGTIEMRHDLPGEAPRLFAAPAGVDRVMVNGVDIVIDGKATEATPGKFLRSGEDQKITV